MRYKYGHPDLGRSPETGFDCSGLVGFVLRAAGLHVPDYLGVDDVRRPIRHANEFWEHYGTAVHAPRKQPGDLILFSKEGRHPTHIGITLDEDRYIHSPGKPDMWVEIQTIREELIPHTPGERGQYVTNPVGYKAPMVSRQNPTYRFPARVL